MNARRLPRHSRRPAGYTLIEVLAASGLIAGALAAAASLSLSMANQEELARGKASAIRYGEAAARLWQLGVNPATILLTQSQGAKGSATYNPMTLTITPGTAASMGNDGGIDQGTMETATITVTWQPYGNTASNTSDLTFNVLRPPAAHR